MTFGNRSAKALVSFCIALAPAFFVSPANATSCERRIIAGRSADESAADLMDGIDRVGIGVLRDISHGDVMQQEVEIIIPFKGAPGRLKLAPYRIGMIGVFDGLKREFNYKENELHLFALVRDFSGKEQYVTPVCLMFYIMEKPMAELIPALQRRAEMAVRHGAAAMPATPQ